MHNVTDTFFQRRTTLYLVRHGATIHSGRSVYVGSTEVPLSAKGVRQMQATATRIRRRLRKSGVMLSAIYCSDLQRAVMSATIVAQDTGLTPEKEPALRERDFGRWEGLGYSEILARYPVDCQAWQEDPVGFAPETGESLEAVRARTLPAFSRIMARHQGETIAVVAHGGVNRILLCECLGIPLTHIFRIEQDPAGLNIIEYWDDFAVVKLLNG